MVALSQVVPAPDPSSPASSNILVVDDAEENRAFVQAVLESEGYQVQLACHGQEALEWIKRETPDLVLSDVSMPVMDGTEMTRHIRKKTGLPFIPILLITAQAQVDVVGGLDAGADDFIRKPVEIDELLARVRSLLRLKQSIDEQKRIAQLREDFVARLSHDLRTPLVAEGRMLELLQQEAFGPLTPEMAEIITLMAQNHQSVMELAETLLEVHRYEMGQKTLNFAPVDWRRLVEQVVQHLHPIAVEKGIELTVEESNAPGEIQMSGARVELWRVLTNLVGNALKFTDKGHVLIRLQDLDQKIELDIEDTGIGIPESELNTVFERFRQGSHSRAGAGLGMFLTQQIVQAHGGEITVRSKVGQGTCFNLQFPRP